MDKDAIFRSLLRVVVFLTAISTWAAPAIRGSFTVCQPDGTLLTIEQFGDEHHHWTSTSDGTLVVNKGGAYYVAAIDDAGCLSATSILAHEAPERGSKEQQQIAVQASRKALFHQRGDEMLTRAMTISSTGGYLPHKGTTRVLTILAAFQDSTFTINEPVQAFEQYLNGEEQTDLGNKNHNNLMSVQQYFKTCSHGQFSPQFDIVGPVTLPHELAYYGGTSGTGGDDKFSTFCRDAVTQVKDMIPDWTVYDNDGDGKAELVCIIYAGYGQNQGGGVETLWARASRQNIEVSKDFKINFFNCSPEHLYPVNSIDAQGVAMKDYINGTGVFIHEMSHCMGLPDLYNTNKKFCSDQGMESWDVMDNGCYNRNSFAPCAYTAWEQEVMEWKEMETVTASQHISGLLPLVEGGTAYKIPNTAKENEYIVIESVMKRGINQYAYGSGLLVYHVDYPSSKVNMLDGPNNEIGHPRVAVVPASGLFLNAGLCGKDKDYTDAQWRASMGSAVFPGTDQVTSLTSDMNLPNYYFYDDDDATLPVGFDLYDITESADGVSFDIRVSGADDIHAPLVTTTSDQDYYTLQGVRVAVPTKGNIYIHQGHLMIWR